MDNIVNCFIDFSEFTDLTLVSANKYTTIVIGKRKVSPSQQYIFKTFNFECFNSKYQKIIMQTFTQLRKQRIQYLQVYERISFISFQSTFQPTFSMNYISTTNLSTLFQTPNFDTEWTKQDAIQCLIAVATGLSYLHDNLIYHGNLNPNNIIIDKSKQCYLSDFGLYPIKNLYMKSEDITNLDYKDPNYKDSEPTDKNDVYSFGVLMFQLCYIFFVPKIQKTTNEIVIKLDQNKINLIPTFFAEIILSCIDSDLINRTTIKKIIKKLKNSTYQIGLNTIKDIYNDFIKTNYLEKLSKLGDDFALNQLGEMYEEGINCKKNSNKALLCYQKAALNNNSEAQSNYGVLLQEESDKSDKNKKEGAKFLKLSAEQGNVNGMANYGIALKIGDGVKPDLKLALDYLKKSADLGNAYAQVNYGYTLLENKPNFDQINEGLKYIKLAMNQGFSDAFYTYGILLKIGDVIEKNEKLAMHYFKIAADMGYNEAMFEYAKGYCYGEGVPQNVEMAVKYFKLADQNGNKKAKRQLNYLLKSGNKTDNNNKLIKKKKKKSSITTIKNKTEKIKDDNDDDDLINEKTETSKLLSIFKSMKNDYKNAIDQKDLSKFQLFKFEDDFINTKNALIIYKFGKLYDKIKPDKAMYYYKMAADLGNPKAQATYGVALQNGKEIKQDLKLGFQYLEKSANQGDLNGMSNYGLALYNGDGTESNKELGLMYLKEAADLGYPFAQLNYGICAYDPKVGHEYLEKLVNLNYKKAFFYYAKDYLEGHGVKKDIIKAESIFHELYDMEGKTKVLVKLVDCLVEINFVEALKYIKILADLDDRGFTSQINKARFQYGIELFYGKNIDKDIPKAIEYLKKSNQMAKIKKEYPDIYVFFENDFSMIKSKIDDFLAKNIENIDGTEKDSIEKVYTGDIECFYQAAKIFEKYKDLESANFFYKIAANYNNKDALFVLGKDYLEGKNEFAKDQKKGKDYLKKAAEFGSLEAKCELIKYQFKSGYKNLGNKFIVYNLLPDITELAAKQVIPAIILKAKFLAITESYNEAKEELQKALALANDNAHYLYKIGKLYIFISKDDDFGLKLIEKSSNEEIKASYFLGKYYYENKNKSPQYLQKAGHFLKIAAENNIKNAKLLLRNYNAETLTI